MTAPEGQQPRAKLYVIPGSHPSMTARRAMELKGIPYDRVDLMPVISHGVLRALRFPSNTVPSLSMGQSKVTGSMQILRELDRVAPEPPLYPSEADLRAAVEEAERWGDDALQGPVRRILWNAIQRDRSVLGSYAEGARLGVPIGLAVRTGGPLVVAAKRMNKAGDDAVRSDLAALPDSLRRVDDWIAEGVLGGESPNAADLQIAASLRLAMTLEDLRPTLEARPAGELALRVIPDFPGHAPPVLPPAWLEPLRQSEPAGSAR